MPHTIIASSQTLGRRVFLRSRVKTPWAWNLGRRPLSKQALPPLEFDAREKTPSLERDVIVSILESSPTRRDAKAYIQTYLDRKDGSWSPTDTTQQASLSQVSSHVSIEGEAPRIAIVSLRRVQTIDDAVLTGVFKTLCQLHALGLSCIIVVDCGAGASPFTLLSQAHRASRLIDGLDAQRAQVIDGTFSSRASDPGALEMDSRPLTELLHKGITPVIVPTGIAMNPHRVESVNYSEAILALGRAITETRSRPVPSNPTGNLVSVSSAPSPSLPKALASVERVIILDPLGALPLKKRPGSCHRLVNLRQESKSIIHWLLESAKAQDTVQPIWALLQHAENMGLARDALDALPSMPSVLITSPSAAAYRSSSAGHVDSHRIASAVRTRVPQNPLIHNLLTDKPIYSSSLPIQRLYAGGTGNPKNGEEPIRATLVKRGLPLTIYPDPMVKPWTRPMTGADRPRLTDAQVDLERLTHLIDDSFGRSLDVDHYVNRVNQNLAGIVVAGNYEGCAILTWEAAVDPVSGKRAMVPYLDKFAVLRSSQGNSGVADFLFNTLVQDCFPDGLCWRSRKTNPVNKWYFERSMGFLELENSDWTMFWTSPNVTCGSPLLRDYELACRDIEPSWKAKA